MKTGFILLTVLVIVVAVVSGARSQTFGPPGSMPGPGVIERRERNHLSLIDDTKVRFGPSQMDGVGRYSIATFNGSAILLDSATGNTWLLTSRKDGQPPYHWIPIPKKDNAPSALKKESNEENDKSDASDPFGPPPRR